MVALRVVETGSEITSEEAREALALEVISGARAFYEKSEAELDAGVIAQMAGLLRKLTADFASLQCAYGGLT